eukprot:jgi/Picsp_1/932/NSC_04417-R1_protein
MCTCEMELLLPQDLFATGGPNEMGFGTQFPVFMPAMHEHQVPLQQQEASVMHTATELNSAEYSTDDFRMFQFKVTRCSKRFVHDWRSCPFAHPTENARRRDPRQVKYLPVPCPDYKRGICLRGDGCPYSHGVYECWLHPAKYKTQLCKEGPRCSRPVCFFAHTVADLRQPTHILHGGSATQKDVAQAPKTVAATLLQQMVDGRDVATIQNLEDEAMNNFGALNSSFNQGERSDDGTTNNEACRKEKDSSDDDSGSASRHDTASSLDVPATPPALSRDRSAVVTTEDVSLVGLSSPNADIARKMSPSFNGHQVARRVSVDGDPGQPDRKSTDNAVWTTGLNVTAAAAQALSGIPVNEQPLMPNQGPRMSNAVARKLGLAPSRTSSSSTGGVMSPQRNSLDATFQTNGRRLSLDGGSDLHAMSNSYGSVPPLGFNQMPCNLSEVGNPYVHPALMNMMNNPGSKQVGEHHQDVMTAANWLGSTQETKSDIVSLMQSMGQWNLGGKSQEGQMPGRGSSDSLMGTFAPAAQSSTVGNGFHFPATLDLHGQRGC